MAFKSPLTRDQYDALKRDQRKLADIKEAIQRAKNCGVDCEGQAGAVQHIEDLLNAYETNFFDPVPK